jgi:hypothetical protein
MSQPLHHVLFNRNTWRGSNTSKEIRENTWLKVPLDTLSHTALHRAVSVVPLPDRHTIQRVASDFIPVRGDYLASMEALIESIDKSSLHHRTQPLERDLACLAMRAIELQMPFVAEGLEL